MSVYVYLHHQGFDFFLTEKPLSEAECYCATCEESDLLLGIYHNEEQLAVKLWRLFSEGYDFLPTGRFSYNDVVRRFCPSGLRALFPENQKYVCNQNK